MAVRKPSVTPNLAVEAHRLIDALERHLIGKHGSVHAIPPAALECFKGVLEPSNGTHDTVSRHGLRKIRPKTDEEAGRVIRELFASFAPLSDPNISEPLKEPLPGKDSIRFVWIKFGLYRYGSDGGISYSPIDWKNPERRKFALQHLIELTKKEGKTIFDLTPEIFSDYKIERLLRFYTGPFRIPRALADAGFDLKLADITRFAVSNYNDSIVALVYFVASIHRLAIENKRIRSYKHITSSALRPYANTRTTSCKVYTKATIPLLIEEAIKKGYLPQNFKELKRHLKDGCVVGLEIIEKELENNAHLLPK